MRPADIIVEIRQRSEWEAVDLGFALVKQLWRSIFPAWALLLLLFSACCLLLVPEDYIWAAGLILWWIKPLFDRVLLHILSRELFAQTLTVAEVFSAIPGLLKNTGLFGALTWRRFSFSRQYNLPIWQLEQLRGKAKSERQELLYIQGHSHAIGLTITCVMLQSIIAISLYFLVIMFDPTGQVWEHVKAMFTGTSGADNEYWMSVGDFMAQTIAIFIIEPFFVAGGFALYLNRRTQLEAWDIEIAFRSIGERLQAIAAKTLQLTLAILVPALLITALSGQTPALADEEFLNAERLPVAASTEQLEKVMQVDELNNRRQVQTWVPKDKSRDNDEIPEVLEGFAQLMSAIIKYMLWAVVLVMVVMAFVYREKILALLKTQQPITPEQEQPDTLFGMDIRPESLPDDIAGHARKLWQQGQQRSALSLLYRGALMQLTRRDEVQIADSHTEGDILQLSRSSLDTQRYDYLHKITGLWQSIAYAHRIPSDTHATAAFDGWSAFQTLPEIAPSVTTAEKQEDKP